MDFEGWMNDTLWLVMMAIYSLGEVLLVVGYGDDVIHSPFTDPLA